MPPIKTYSFQYTNSPNVVVTIQAYDEQVAWNILRAIGLDSFDFTLENVS